MANLQNVEEQLMDFLRTRSKRDDLTEEMSIRDELGLDSMDITELVFLVEDLLGQRIEDAELQRLVTIRDALDLLRENGTSQ